MRKAHLGSVLYNSKTKMNLVYVNLEMKNATHKVRPPSFSSYLPPPYLPPYPGRGQILHLLEHLYLYLYLFIVPVFIYSILTASDMFMHLMPHKQGHRVLK